MGTQVPDFMVSQDSRKCPITPAGSYWWWHESTLIWSNQVSGALAFTINFHLHLHLPRTWRKSDIICLNYLPRVWWKSDIICQNCLPRIHMKVPINFHLQNFLGWKFGLDHCMTHGTKVLQELWQKSDKNSNKKSDKNLPRIHNLCSHR